MKEGEGFDFDGSMVDITLVKSRSNKAGQFARLVFNQTDGFDEELSLFVLLKDNKKVNGAGAYLYLGDRSDMKFAQKNFKTKLRELPELREVFMKEVSDVLKDIASKQNSVEDDYTTFTSDLSANILSNMNNAIA